MIRGISFQIPNGYFGLFSVITEKIYLNIDFWFITEGQIFNRFSNECFFESDKYKGNDFQKKIIDKNYYIIFANLQAYPTNKDFVEIKTYDDFQKSNCEIMILISDSIFVDIYAKNKNIIETIQLNAQENNFTKITYITDENDRRTDFCAI